MKNVTLLLVTLVGSLAIVFGVAVFFSRSIAPDQVSPDLVVNGARHFSKGTTTDTTLQATESAEASDSAKTVVQVVEFSDFQCPACKAALPIKDQLLAQFPDQVEFVYRHYPLLAIHPNALIAAQASEAAAKFDKFWPMHDKLFAMQSEWEALSNDQAKEKFVQYAKELEINEQEFLQHFDAETTKQNVQTDISAGDALQVNATPTFYVNGIKVSAPDVLSTVEAQLK